jgi:hypothetical protein
MPGEPGITVRLTKERKLRNVDRYLKLVKWARNRYTRNKILNMSSGNVPSIYVRIVSAAWSKYMA